MAEGQAASGGGMSRLILWLLILALLGMVWFLASERNQRHYRLAGASGQLAIERGRFFPLGTTASDEKIYAPLAPASR
jgi:hypothetical protein